MEKSDSIAQLATALAVAQGKMQAATRASENPFLKSYYADIAAVMEVCREPLSSNGLSVVQLPEFFVEGVDEQGSKKGRWVLRSMLLHKSGEWISSVYPLSPKDSTAQSIGAAVTYARRYALMALVGVVSSLDDDDGESLQGRDTVANKPNKDWSNFKKEGSK